MVKQEITRIDRTGLFKISFNQKIAQIKGGDKFLCLVTDKGELYGFGNNDVGQLGMGLKVRNVQEFTKIKIDNCTIKCLECECNFTVVSNIYDELFFSGTCEASQLGLKEGENHTFNFVKIKTFPHKIRQIKCADGFTMILTQNNLLYGSGDNSSGQLGFGNEKEKFDFEMIEISSNQISNVQVGVLHSAILYDCGEVFVTGSNEFGQLGLSSDTLFLRSFKKLELSFLVKQIGCYNYGTLLLSSSHDLYVCGCNELGQIGVKNDKKYVYGLQKVSLPIGPIIQITSCRDSGNVLITETNEIFAAGINFYGLHKRIGESLEKSKIVTGFTRLPFTTNLNDFEVTSNTTTL
ncbi:hypothetical protein ABK040_006079 [Willaertia magna]